MSNYKIISTEPSNENGYVYVYILVNNETEPRKLILPDDEEAAKAKMVEYFADEDAEPETPPTDLDGLVDQTIEV